MLEGESLKRQERDHILPAVKLPSENIFIPKQFSRYDILYLIVIMNEQVKDIYTSEIFISKYINSKYKNKLNTDTLNYRVNSV